MGTLADKSCRNLIQRAVLPLLARPSWGLRPRNSRAPQNPLDPPKRIWRIWMHAEDPAAIVQRKSWACKNDARSEGFVVALDKRHHVSIAVDDAQIRRIVSNRDFSRGRVAVGFVRVN